MEISRRTWSLFREASLKALVFLLSVSSVSSILLAMWLTNADTQSRFAGTGFFLAVVASVIAAVAF